MTRESSKKGLIGLVPRLSWRSRTTRLAAAGAAIVAVAFVVGAFLVAPLLVDRAVRQYAARLPDRSAQVERISINPFTLTVELGGVDLREPQAGAALTIDRVRVNFDFLTLFQRARVLDELSIETPRLTLDPTREDGDRGAGFDELLAAIVPAQPTRIQRFSIAEGQVEIGGASSEAERRLALENVAVSANDLASDSDASSDYLLTAREAAAGASLRLEGEIAFAPLVTRGRIEVRTLALETLRPWLGGRFAAARVAGYADVAAEYALSREPDAAVVRLTGATAAVRALRLDIERGIEATAAEATLQADAEMSLTGGVWAAAGDGEFDLTNIAIRSASDGLLFASEHVAASGASVRQAGLDREAPRISIDALRLQRPQTRIFLSSDEEGGPENGARVDYPLSGLLSIGASHPSAIPVQRVELIDAQIDIVDRAFSPPQLLRPTAVNGTVARAAREEEGLLVDLEGDVGEKGSGKIVARVSHDGEVARREVALTARSIDAAVVSRYFSELAGREVGTGLLDFDIEYRLLRGGLEGHARIAALDLTFADAGAADGLRWDLAVALLEDESGRLEVATPLSADSTEESDDEIVESDGAEDDDGSDGDAAFAGAIRAARSDGVPTHGGIASAVLSALGGLVSRVTSAPFEVLGELAGREAAALRAISFEPGAAEPSEAGMEALEDLSGALAQRPRLALLIAGRADPELDRDALAAQQIELHVTLATAGPTLIARPKPVDFSSPRAWDVLDEFAMERLSEERLATVASYFPLDADGQVVAVEKPSYYRALFDELVANEPIPENALNRLGRYRAQSIADALGDLGIAPERTEILVTHVTADARERSLPASLPGSTPPASDSEPADGVQREGSLPERIAVPLEVRALANLDVDGGLQAVTGDAAAD